MTGLAGSIDVYEIKDRKMQDVSQEEAIQII